MRTRSTLAALTAAAATAAAVLMSGGAAQASTGAYAALGDSYSSGLGAGSYGSSGSCDRSAYAYGQDWANADSPSSFDFAACSGATTADVVNTQAPTLSAATALVSLTIGGNDVGFSSVMETCVLDSTSSCVSAVDSAENEANTTLPAELDSALSAIASHAPNARVVVLDYPELYDLSESSGCIGLSTTDRTDLNQAADVLDTQIQDAASRHGDVFVDVRSYFTGHEICDSDSWLHSVNFLDIGESYHPTQAGQQDAYYPAFAGEA